MIALGMDCLAFNVDGAVSQLWDFSSLLRLRVSVSAP